MSLIEGIGDEVTLIVGLLTLIAILLVAWFSTHTREIPFFSVIVVELSQRVTGRQDQQSRAGAPAGGAGPLSDSQSSGTSADVPPTTSLEAPPSGTSSDIHPSGASLDVPPNKNASAGHAGSRDSGETLVKGSEGVDVKNVLKIEKDDPLDSENPDTQSSSRGGECEKSENTIRHRNVTGPGSAVDVDTSQATRPSSSAEPLSGASSLSTEKDISSTQSSLSAAQNESRISERDSHQGQIRIRLKYLNDTQRLVYSSPSETIGQFRRAHFSSELAANKLVRLIFNGQDMRNDTSTLQGYNITDNSVIHCLVTQNIQGNTQTHFHNHDGDLQLGSFMLPLFALILAVMWYLRLTQRQYFNAISTLSLVGVTFLFLLGCASTLRGGPVREHVDVDVD